MTNRETYQIKAHEMAVSLLAATPSVGFLSSPRELTEVMQTADSWIVIILYGFLTMVVISLYTHLQRKYPGQNLLEFIGQGKFGYWISKGLALFFVIFFVSLMAYQLHIFGDVVKLYLLIYTPSEFTTALIVLLAAYAVSKGTQGIIHLNLMFVPITFLVIIFMLAFNIPNVNLHELRPLFPEGVSPILRGMTVAFPAFIGIEMLFFFMSSMKASQIRAFPLNVSIMILMTLNVLVTMGCIAIFSLQSTKLITFPTVELAKEIEIPGGFFERVESLMLTVWVMSIFNALSISYLLAVHNIQAHFVPRVNKIWVTASVAFIVICLAFVPQSITEAFIMRHWVNSLGLILILAGLSCGYLTYWNRKHRHNLKDVGR
ncbi:GerAB/ArcD/ProY family transporter [Salicibibacter cibi]|uniref:GerAB/ArcD/ProY family transporter n=1 Tax=Salicibibacter cibi TaxID=2743001 RepID=A0A7T6ZE86_9BACI|nr:GerAB/ArcD/ProY family transporter [Salicibibacter cibi]QQK81446.1 GerAB/ArcD/ProY family transporter [Salicibibacter cibi]